MPPAWFGRDAWEVGPDLLNKIIAARGPAGWVSARIVEVEAYASFDPASHSHRGPTARNAVMFGPPGRLYVYFSYGMHWCANVVTGPDGSGQAVLLRAGEPVTGIGLMVAARFARPEGTQGAGRPGGPPGGPPGGRPGGRVSGAGSAVPPAGSAVPLAGAAVPLAPSARDLTGGPARLAQALGLTGADSGLELRRTRQGRCVVILDDGTPPPSPAAVGPRVGITKAPEVPWRWWVPGSLAVSAWRPGKRRRPSSTPG